MACSHQTVAMQVALLAVWLSDNLQECVVPMVIASEYFFFALGPLNELQMGPPWGLWVYLTQG